MAKTINPHDSMLLLNDKIEQLNNIIEDLKKSPKCFVGQYVWSKHGTTPEKELGGKWKLVDDLTDGSVLFTHKEERTQLKYGSQPHYHIFGRFQIKTSNMETTKIQNQIQFGSGAIDNVNWHSIPFDSGRGDGYGGSHPGFQQKDVRSSLPTKLAIDLDESKCQGINKHEYSSTPMGRSALLWECISIENN